MSKIMKTLNGYEVVDEKARQDIATLQNKQVEVDLSNYYNKAETDALVDNAIDNIDIPTVDLTPYATKQYVNEEIAKIEIPEGGNVDLDGYATETWVNNQGFIKEHQSLDGYATETWVKNQGYLTEHQSLNDYAKKSDIPTIPTNISAFTNDVGYLKEHQSLDGYATEKYVDDAISNIDIPEGTTVDLSNYYTKGEIDSKIHEINSTSDSRYTVLTTSIETINNAGYQTEAQVATAIKNSRSDYDEWVGVMLDGIEQGGYDSVKEYIDDKFANIATAEGGSY